MEKNENFVEIKVNRKQFFDSRCPSPNASYQCRKEMVQVMNKFRADVGAYALSMIIVDLYYAYGKKNTEAVLDTFKELYDSSNAMFLPREEYEKLWSQDSN